MSQDELTEFIREDLLGDPAELVIALVFSFLLGLFISQVYRVTHRGVTFSQSFANTLVILTIVTTFILFFIDDSLARGFGLFAVFSIIRFRTAAKDSRDTAFVLFALGTGMAVGVGSVPMAFVGVATVGLFIYLMSRFNLTNAPRHDFVIHFIVDSKKGSVDAIGESLRRITKSSELLNVNTKKQGDTMEFSFNITLKRNSAIENVVKTLNKQKGVSEVTFITAKNDIVY